MLKVHVEKGQYHWVTMFDYKECCVPNPQKMIQSVKICNLQLDPGTRQYMDCIIQDLNACKKPDIYIFQLPIKFS